MLSSLSQIRLSITVMCLSLTVLAVGCNQPVNGRSSSPNTPAKQTSDRSSNKAATNTATSNGGTATQETIAQAGSLGKTDKSSFLNGRYLVGHTGQGLEIDGDRYRYDDEGGAKPWRSITELQAIKEGVIYDGNAYWCLNTMKSRDQVGSCSENGWVIYKPSNTPEKSTKIPALEKGMSYEQARQLVIDAGWQPLMTTTDNPNDGTKFLRDRGFNEVSSCSGTGMGFCRFEFTGSGNQKFVVVTGGRESSVQKWFEETAEPPAAPENNTETSNLPFVGKRFFNFLGGSGTGYTITIGADGDTVIQQHGTMNHSTVYEGPFQETMTIQTGQSITIKDGYADSCGEPSKNPEGESAPCRAKLYE
jgi:hypothetical protein